MRKISIALAALSLLNSGTLAADQTSVGTGNKRAEEIGRGSPLIRSALRALVTNASKIADRQLRSATLDIMVHPKACVVHRANLTDNDKDAIIQHLISEGLLNPKDGSAIPGGLKAGVFPPLLAQGTPCPRVPLDFYAAPGSSDDSHHAYPGGLAMHEAFNQQSAVNLAATYRQMYGGLDEDNNDLNINQDVILAAPAWHDWAKTMVFQWNADGTEFTEFRFGGTGTHDNAGKPGDSRTGAHHIIGIAEAMARGLSPLMVITQASAHSAPTLGNEYKVVNWLRAGSILARIDPVAKGYLTRDAAGTYQLPQLQKSGDANHVDHERSHLRIEYQIHNLSDGDYVNSVPALLLAQSLLKALALDYGYHPSDVATYNTKFRNVVLSNLGAERIEILYSQSGLFAVRAALNSLRKKGILHVPQTAEHQP